jgi:GT2 family glycosyltransferase
MKLITVIPHYGDDSLIEKVVARKQWDNLIVVNNNPPNENVYFTAAVNNGIEQAVEYGADIIWLLNNDALPEYDCSQRALECFMQEGLGKCGIVGSQNRLSTDMDRITWGGSLEAYPMGRHKNGKASHGDCQERSQEQWITFASVFLNVNLIKEIGYLDENMRHIGSDSDYCYRARQAGWKCYHEPKSIIYHTPGSSAVTPDVKLGLIKQADMDAWKHKWVTREWGKIERVR